MRIGFAGLGLMGLPMAANLRRAGMQLTVYNRSPEPCETLRGLGATVAPTAKDLFAVSDAVILMLANDQATDWVLGRGGVDFRSRVSNRLIVNMGTHAPRYSEDLARETRSAGGAFVEAPVSGSRQPACDGELIAMLAGDAADRARARPLLEPMCRDIIDIGAPPSAMRMKMAVNLYLIATVAALGEAVNLAACAGLDLDLYNQILLRGPLRSDVSAIKLPKMIGRDYAPQALVRDVVKNGELVAETAALCGAPAPILNQSLRLFQNVLGGGGGDLDMAAIVTAFAQPGREWFQ